MAKVVAVNAPVSLLFVDDEPTVLTAVKRLLADMPCELLTAASGEQALEVLRKRPIDVLVSDVDMPVMSGLQLVARVRRDFPSTLRMLLTATPTQERVLQAINEGEVSRFFVKPFDAKMFRESVRALAGRIEHERRARTEGASQQRRDALLSWACERYPGLLDIARTGDDAIALDLERAKVELTRLRALGTSAPEKTE